MYPVDSTLASLRSRLARMDATDWDNDMSDILPIMQSLDANGAWIGADNLDGWDGLEYVRSVVAEWCTDAGV